MTRYSVFEHKVRLWKVFIVKRLSEIEYKFQAMQYLLTNQYSHTTCRRQTVKEMYDSAGCYREQKFCMDELTFEQLHNLLQPLIEKAFAMNNSGEL